MTGNDDWPLEQRSRPLWQESAPQSYGERLVRVEEGLRHTIDKSKTSSERIRLLADRATANETRLTTLETEQRRCLDTLAKIEPLATDYQRRKDRRQFIKEALNWATIPAMAYMAFSGKASLADMLGALAKIFGVP